MNDKDKRERTVERTSTDETGASSELPLAAQEAIGRLLRRSYSTLLDEPLPSRFNDLLEQLARIPDTKDGTP